MASLAEVAVVAEVALPDKLPTNLLAVTVAVDGFTYTLLVRYVELVVVVFVVVPP